MQRQPDQNCSSHLLGSVAGKIANTVLGQKCAQVLHLASKVAGYTAGTSVYDDRIRSSALV